MKEMSAENTGRAYVVFEASPGERTGVYRSWSEVEDVVVSGSAFVEGFECLEDAVSAFAGAEELSHPRAYYCVSSRVFQVYRLAYLAAGRDASRVRKFEVEQEALDFAAKIASESAVGPPKLEGLLAEEPLVLAFDLETTSLAQDAQIVEIAILEYERGTLLSRESLRFKPTVAIVAGAEAKHKISAADVAGEALFDRAQALSLRRRFEKATAVVGYRIAYDLNVLNRELKRLRVEELDLGHLHFFDPFVLWSRHEEHALKDAVKRFLGRSHGSAHAALADTIATLQLLPPMLKHFDLADASAADLTSLFLGNGIHPTDRTFTVSSKTDTSNSTLASTRATASSNRKATWSGC